MRRPQRVALFPAPSSGPGVVAGWGAVLRRRWRAGSALFLGTAGLAATVLLLARPVWRAESSLRLGAPAPVGGVSLGGTGSPAGLFSLFQQMTGDPFANELELLSSRTVVEGVVEDEALNVQLDAPRGWYRDSLFSSLGADRSTGRAAYRVEWLPAGRVRVSRTAPDEAPVGEFAPGEAARFGGVRVAFRLWRAGMPREVALRTLPFGDATRRTGPRLVAERQRREANLVKLSYDDPDPGLALGVVRSASARYAALRTELQRRESSETTDSLRGLADRTLAELRRQEDGLERFERDSRLVAPEAQSEEYVKRRGELVTSLAKARAELAGTEDVLRRVDIPRADGGSAWAGLVAHPTFMENQALGDLLTRLVGLEEQRIELAGRRTAEDRQVRVLDTQIAHLDESLRSLVRQYRDGVAREVVMLEGELAKVDAALDRVPAGAVELGRRTRSVRLLSEVYLFTDQRLRQESLRDAVSFATVQVVDPPAVLFKPIWPRKGLGMAAGLMLALVFSALGMALSERADGTIRSVRELRARVDAPVLATLVAPPGGEIRLPPRERRAILGARRSRVPDRRLTLVPVDDPSEAEALARALAGARAPRPAPVPAGAGEAAAGNGGDPAPVKAGPGPGDNASALEVASTGGDVVLVARAGATRLEDLAAATARLREVDARVAGVVLLARDDRQASAAWR
jgi:uncharacterized protein involved in exopolysaccharide biosynthesis